jgi:4-amino-4-deoxy-L-arabinose transferase-like glycosyltransferase
MIFTAFQALSGHQFGLVLKDIRGWCRPSPKKTKKNGGYIFLGFFLVFFWIFFCFSVWSSFPCYLLLFGAKICVLHAFWS